MGEQEQEITLTFKVPETDFDAIALEVALSWVKEKVESCAYPWDEHSGIRAYNILKVIHDRYMDALGEPGWKKPPLSQLIWGIREDAERAV